MANLIFICSLTNQNYFEEGTEIYNAYTLKPISRKMDVFGKNVMYQMLLIITNCHGSEAMKMTITDKKKTAINDDLNGDGSKAPSADVSHPL